MDDVLVYYIPRASVAPTSDVSQAEYEALEDRVDVLEDGQELGDLSDVTLSSVAAGQIIQRNGTNDGWENVNPVGGVTTVEQNGTPVNTADVTVMDFTDGITVTETTPGEVEVEVAFAGTGAAASAARSDHSHGGAVQGILTGSATGNLSSGTRDLSTATLGTLTSGIVYDLTATALVRCRNNVSSGTVNLLLRIGIDGSYPQRSRSVQTVGGVPVDQIIHFQGVFTGAGSGLPLSWQIQFSSGDATDVRDWEFVYQFSARR